MKLNDSSNRDRAEREQLFSHLSEADKRERETLRRELQQAKEDKLFTPEIVAKFAYLHMQTEEGVKIYPAPHHWLWLELLCDFSIKKLHCARC